ncbi:uncharacterized protein JCM15063_003648 [Sporobolomyces koalae]|uniref:uncharacterized protein n=1 Tax=Sporobolomyces koalae TaxID=500713 RepID=UPI003180FB69
MDAPARARAYNRSRDSSIGSQTSFRAPALEPPLFSSASSSSLSAAFEDRFPQASTSFALPHSRSASNSSKHSLRSSTGSEAGTGRLPRTTSLSTWGTMADRDLSHDVELLLGEDGRGKGTSGASSRSTTPSRLEHAPWAAADERVPDIGPATPRSASTRYDDLDTTPTGLPSRAAASRTHAREPSSPRPLHTPPQLLPATSFSRSRTGSPAPSTHSRVPSHPVSSALRPPSAKSSSSNSSSYSFEDEEDNSWATDLAPTHLDDVGAISLRSPLLAENEPSAARDQARPISEFDIMGAYARSDTAASLPSSPMLPTVGTIQPASPVIPSPEERSDLSLPEPAAGDPSILGDPTSPTAVQPKHLQAATTPISSRAPSPTPSLSPSVRPSSRTSNRSALSSPVRPPRRQTSSLSLAPRTDSVSVSPAATPNANDPVLADSAPLAMSSSRSSSEDATTKVSPPRPHQPHASPVMGSPRSPRPPSIPEKSRRRTSVMGLGLKKSPVKEETTEPSSAISKRVEETAAGGLTSPSTPLSASDFADVYGRLDWTSPSPSISNATTSPTPARSSHIRDAATFDLPTPSPSLSPSAANVVTNGALLSVAMDTRTNSSTSSRYGEDGDREVFADASTGLSPNLVNIPATADGGFPFDAVPRSGDRSSPTVELKAGRSSTPKGDAKARAAAFIADLKKSRLEAEQEPPGEVQTELAESSASKVEPAKPSATTATNGTLAPATSQTSILDPRPSSSARTASSESMVQTQNRLRTQSRASTLSPPVAAPRQASQQAIIGHSLPPLLRRRPLPMSIQATGELQRARTAGERARIYAAKINDLSREKSRLDEWIDVVRNPRFATTRGERLARFLPSRGDPVLEADEHRRCINRRPITATANSRQHTSPLKTARSFRQDSSTATFAPRGDGYRAKEITPSTFGPRDMQPTTPYPGVLSYNSSIQNGFASHGTNSSRSTLGSGLPSASAGGPGRPSFFSRSLGRRTSKREPPSTVPIPRSTGSSNGAGGGGIQISNPSPLLYSSSALTTTASSVSVGANANNRSVGGPRMPGTLSSRASFDSRNNSPVIGNSSPYSGSPNFASAHPHRASFSYGTLISPPESATSPPSPMPGDSEIDSMALDRLTDVLPQASREDLVKALKKAGGQDDILAISMYLSDREAGLKKG